MKMQMKVTGLVLALIISVIALAAIINNLLPGGLLPSPPTSGTSTGPNSGTNSGTNPGTGTNTGSAAGSLKIPVLLQDQNADPAIADFILTAQFGETNFLTGKTTETLGYNGSYLGPVLRIRRGEKVNIRVNNKLSFPTTVHWHGLVVDGEQDGGPHQGILPGESWSPAFTVDQAAATLWYHPHLMEDTADQVYYGLAGLIYIEDDVSDQLNLPKDYGINDFPLIVQDRSFNSDGSFAYRTSMMGVVPGDRILVNGTVDPSLDVNKGNVRFRLLNASNSQNFEFKLSGGNNFQLIATDGGFLKEPVAQKTIFLAPGERAEIVVDFSKINQTNVSLLAGNQDILKINLTSQTADTTEVPQSLAVITPIPESPTPKTRIFELQSMGLSGTINGKAFNMERIDEEVNLNETETWIIRNIGGMMQTDGHPFHVHGTQFQVITRNGRTPPLQEQGFKDTVFVAVGEEVVIRVRFTHPGVFMYHCHILEHEDNGMMGQFSVK